MTHAEPRSHRPEDDDDVEELLARALALLEEQGSDAVDRLLAEHEQHRETVLDALRELHHADMLAAPTAGAPRTFGDYRIKGELGAGGMGVVYLAEQRDLNREFALKVVRPELLLFEGSRERFRREIEAVARLDHPAIVPVVATGSDHGVPYYVMPRLRGRSAQGAVDALAGSDLAGLSGTTLRDVLGSIGDGSDTDADGTFGGRYWQAVVQLVRKAALGLHHAHLRGVLHRDVKPSNLFLLPEGRAVVLDFGLARAGGDPKMTRTGAAAGSPAYMAPEQVRSEPSDERTDVYGLGATLHCLLALRPPFATDDPQALRAAILAGERGELPPQAALPAELRIVLACAMDIDRNRRYASCSAFADDLQAVLDGTPIAARRLPLGLRARRFAQRHRAVTVALAMTLLFAALVPSLLWWQQREASAALQDQVDKTDAANRELERANDELGGANRDLERANARLHEQIERADHSVGVTIDAIERLLAGTRTKSLRNQPGAQAVIADMLRDATELYGSFEFDTKYADRVLKLRLVTLSGLVDVLMAMGRDAQVIETADQMLALIPTCPEGPFRDVNHGVALRFKASLGLERRRPEGVPELLATARELFAPHVDDEQFGEEARRELSLVDCMEASVAMRAGDMPTAEGHLRAACDRTEALRARGNTVTAHYTNVLNLARFLKGNKRYDEAGALIEDVLEDLAPVDARHDRSWPVPRYVRTMARNERSRILQLRGERDAAMAVTAVTLRELDELIGDYPDTPELRRLRSSVRGNLAIMHWQQDDWSAAIHLNELAVADARKSLEMVPGDAQSLRFLATHQQGLCYCLRRDGQFGRLADEVVKLGEMRIPPQWREGAARDALRATAAATPERAAELRELSLQWLVQAHGEGHTIATDNPVYDSVRDDERFAELKQAP